MTKDRAELETEWFRVEVSDRDGQVVAIESAMLAGRDIGEKEEVAVRKAIAHLQGFIGPEREKCPDCGNPIDPDYCHCGEIEAAHNGWTGHSFVPIGCQCGRRCHEPFARLDEKG